MKRLIALTAFAFTLVLTLPGRAVPQEEGKDDLQKKANDYRKHVKELRGLDFKSEVKVGVYSKDELLDFLKDEFDKELPKEKAARYEKAYAHFGLIPKDLELRQGMLDLLGGSIAGFYHPKTKEMRLIRSTGGGLNLQEDMTLVHELTHAAQDQNFDLESLPIDNETNDDLALALKALVEGDATVVGFKYAFKDTFDTMLATQNSFFKKGIGLPGKAAKLPKYLRLTLTFPYGYGSEFVMAAVKGDANHFSSISKLFEQLPCSTSQILHPEKYLDKRINPQDIALPDIAKEMGQGWSLLLNNVHGEFCMRILLGEFKSDELTTKQIEKTCAGWMGDRYAVLEKGEQVSSVWMTTWESEDAAKAFHAAYHKVFAKKHEKPEELKASDDILVLKDGDTKMYLERRGQDVLVIEGAADLIGKADWVWKGTTKKEFKKVERVAPKKDKKKKDYGVKD